MAVFGINNNNKKKGGEGIRPFIKFMIKDSKGGGEETFGNETPPEGSSASARTYCRATNRSSARREGMGKFDLGSR